MRIPLVAHFEHRALKRRFRAANADIRRVYSAGQRHAENARNGGAAALSPAQREHWDRSGFIVLRGFFPPSTIAAYKAHVDEAWRVRARPDNPVVMFGTGLAQFFRDAAEADRTRPYRLLDQYLVDASTRDLCMDPRLTAILHELMGHAPVVCNTLLFEWGSEQDMHSDMFYMSPVSENQMVASWIALDDVTADNGPLVYVPGSHKIPPHRFSHGGVQAITAEVAGAVDQTQAKMDAAGLKREPFLAKSGDVLIWHSRLVHGGGAIRDRSARRTSLVTHYFSTRDLPAGRCLCAEREDGSLLMLKDHLPVD